VALRFAGDDVTAAGVRQRRFDVRHEGRVIPGQLWTPEGATGPRPLVLVGHGAGASKTGPYVVALGRRFVRHHGFAAAAIDGPVHGDRRNDGGGSEISFLEFGQAWQNQPRLLDEAVSDWTCTLDALEELPDVGRGPVGYWGVSMGTILGLPFVAAEPRVIAAVLGLMGISGPTKERHRRDAERLKVPVHFVLQWDDELFAREKGFALFEAIGSTDKRLHAGPGKHAEISRAAFDDSERFLAEHLRAAFA